MKTERAVFGGGCFWCTEAVFSRIKGVKKVTSGYAGGTVEDPTYEQVCTGTTGHAEVVEVEYDPGTITYRQLLDVFFHTHDPTSIDRQGADVGSQYRSIILTTNDAQEREAIGMIEKLNREGEFGLPLATRVKPLETFYPAEADHQNYYRTHADTPYCRMVIDKKIQKLEKEFADRLQ